ncbi:MAG: response regulator [Chthoniobacterales bacterium]|nr:response regulator [Chthoniobacterales bacterium]
MSNETDTAPHEAPAPAGGAPGFDPVLHPAFCAALNHKLRTPLNAIIGFAELAALQAAGRQRDSDLQQILKSAREMLQIIESDLGQPLPVPPKREAAPVTERTCDVLYVEDDLVNFTLVERILEFRPGLKILHAARGQMGVEMAISCQPRLMLLDLNLPDMHGSDVLCLMQRNAVTEQIPVVILSADATPSQIERLLTAGAKNYLTKPFDIEPFLAVVDEYVPVSSHRAAA